MNKLLISGLVLLISSIFTAIPNISSSVNAQQTGFVLSGYVLDSNGNGVVGAHVNFNGAIPNVITNSKGYYATTAPAGTYRIYVWPPYDSSFVNGDESGVVVASDTIRNITLQSAFKVSGYIFNSSNSPMVGASVLFKTGSKVFGSGWYTNSAGYYFINVPAGTYTIDAHPQIAFNPNFTGPCTPFTPYYEYNFAVNSNINKNITVTSLTPSPTPILKPQPSTTPIPITPTPTPTSKPTLPTTLISISTEASSYQVGSTINIKGKLTDLVGNPISDKTVILSSSLDDGASWFSVGSSKTDMAGEYSVQWLIQASGTFNLKAEWAGNNNYRGSSVSTAVSFLPYQDQPVFLVESNSTVTALKFDSENKVLSFNVTGETGTKGYTEVSIAKTLVANATEFTVALDGQQLTYTVNSSQEYWTLMFTYSHSTHQVTINTTAQDTEKKLMATDNSIILLVIVAVIIIVAILGALTYRHSYKKGLPN